MKKFLSGLLAAAMSASRASIGRSSCSISVLQSMHCVATGRAMRRWYVMAAPHDSQVPYWEGAKFVAKVREMKTDDNVVMLKTNMGAGHGGASGRYDRLKEIAFDYVYALTQVGITK